MEIFSSVSCKKLSNQPMPRHFRFRRLHHPSIHPFLRHRRLTTVTSLIIPFQNIQESQAEAKQKPSRSQAQSHSTDDEASFIIVRPRLWLSRHVSQERLGLSPLSLHALCRYLLSGLALQAIHTYQSSRARLLTRCYNKNT